MQVRKVLWKLFEIWPTAAIAAAALPDTLAAVESLIKPLGLFRKRTLAIKRFSAEYLETQVSQATHAGAGHASWRHNVLIQVIRCLHTDPSACTYSCPCASDTVGTMCRVPHWFCLAILHVDACSYRDVNTQVLVPDCVFGAELAVRLCECVCSGWTPFSYMA